MSGGPDNLRVSDELDLIVAVLRGYRDSPAKSDALRAAGVIRAEVEALQKQAELGRSRHDFLNAHLKLWMDSGIPAPLNELQSIATWLRASGEGLREMQSTMRNRMLLLEEQATKLHKMGPEAEDAAGIYEHRPELKPARREE